MRRRGRATVVALAAWALLGAACSSVPDVLFVDRDASAGGDASAGDAAPDGEVTVADAGCARQEDSDVCCGTSVCEPRQCGGARCSLCAVTCGNRRCCDRPGLGVRCVNLDDDCDD